MLLGSILVFLASIIFSTAVFANNLNLKKPTPLSVPFLKSSIEYEAVIKPENSPYPTYKPTLKPALGVFITPTPTSSSVPVENLSIRDYMISQINEYRRSQGLSEVSADRNTCDFAKLRAKEISTDFNHDGFRNRIESNSLPYPSYRFVTENIAMNPDFKKVVTGWINSTGHAENMRKDTSLVCVEKYGNFFAYEGLGL